jgi:dynein heavy chain
MKQKNTNSVFETLGFPEGMTYGHRSSLRKECSRFLRFAYLIDFLSLESLSNVYTGSVQELITRLSNLNECCEMETIMSMNIDDANRQPTGPVRGNEPLFYIEVKLCDKNKIPTDAEQEILIDDFKVHPHGNSTVKDFDPLAHIEVEPEAEIKEPGNESEEEEEMMAEDEPKYKIVVPDIQKYWLQLTPGLDDFYQLITNCFNEGLDCIQVFERWSKHDDLTPYANALEEWDDMVGDNWDAPDSNYLNPHTWISEN